MDRLTFSVKEALMGEEVLRFFKYLLIGKREIGLRASAVVQFSVQWPLCSRAFRRDT